MTARSDRRAVIGGLAGCVAAGAIGAAAATRTARAATETAEATVADKRIIELATEFERLERKRLDLFPESGSAAVIVVDDERDAAIEPIDAEQEAIMDQLATLRCSNLQALGAVARALILWERDLIGDPGDPGECLNRRLGGWLAMQAAAMGGRKA